MFKNSLLSIFLLIFAQQLVAQKKNPYKTIDPKVDFVNAVTKELVVDKTPEKSSLSLTKGENSLIAKTIEVPINKKAIQQMDSIWLKTGDILTGQITFVKDSNSFLFFKDTLQSIKLKPIEVSKLIVFPKNRDQERLDIISIANDFYFLESDAKATIQIYAKRTFKPILDDGPKHYFVQSKYCLFKNNVTYLLNNNKTKEILLFLVQDCKKVVDKFKTGQFTEDNFLEAVLQYNRCNK
jgi:hypothetical protein